MESVWWYKKMEKGKGIKVTQYIFKQIKIGEFKSLLTLFAAKNNMGASESFEKPPSSGSIFWWPNFRANYCRQVKFEELLEATIFFIRSFQRFFSLLREDEKWKFNLLQALQLVFLGSSLPRCWNKSRENFEYFSYKNSWNSYKITKKTLIVTNYKEI